MPTRKKTSQDKLSKRLPRKFTQQQILYALLLVATFLVGYLFATVQALKATPQKTAGAETQQPGAQPTTDPNKKFDVKPGHFPVLGDENAKVTIVAFADFRCPFCERFYTEVEPQIIKDYVDTGKAKFAFRHYAFLGPASTVAANAVECANEQGKFWDMYKYLYENQPSETDTTMYNSDTLSQAAGNLGMDAEQFKGCIDASRYQKNVDEDMADGQKAEVSATPTFFVNGKMILGAQPYENFKAAIEEALAGK
ncbi:MAG: DsbA family protein [Candidatus Levybacteria bacterium]|nr:DsbA family protein [Candidatus Levybacteria bacterium]MBP9814705.1 DsbA family protein [Candidatus Levybacteria bacterium]